MSASDITTALAAFSVTCTPTHRGGALVYAARYAELPYCIAEGETREAALRELEAIAPSYVEGMLADGGEIPVPLQEGGAAAGMFTVSLFGMSIGGAPASPGTQSRPSFGGLSTLALHGSLTPA